MKFAGLFLALLACNPPEERRPDKPTTETTPEPVPACDDDCDGTYMLDCINAGLSQSLTVVGTAGGIAVDWTIDFGELDIDCDGLQEVGHTDRVSRACTDEGLPAEFCSALGPTADSPITRAASTPLPAFLRLYHLDQQEGYVWAEWYLELADGTSEWWRTMDTVVGWRYIYVYDDGDYEAQGSRQGPFEVGFGDTGQICWWDIDHQSVGSFHSAVDATMAWTADLGTWCPWDGGEDQLQATFSTHYAIDTGVN